MKALGLLLRLWSYLFHFILSLFLLGLGLLAYSSHQSLKLTGLLPFTDDKMIFGVVTLAVFGLVCILLAVTGIFRYLFPLWTAVVLYLLIKGVFFSPYTFGGETAFKSMLWLIFGALCAFVGGIWVLKPRRGRL